MFEEKRDFEKYCKVIYFCQTEFRLNYDARLRVPICWTARRDGVLELYRRPVAY